MVGRFIDASLTVAERNVEIYPIMGEFPLTHARRTKLKDNRLVPFT